MEKLISQKDKELGALRSGLVVRFPQCSTVAVTHWLWTQAQNEQHTKLQERIQNEQEATAQPYNDQINNIHKQLEVSLRQICSHLGLM